MIKIAAYDINAFQAAGELSSSESAQLKRTITELEARISEQDDLIALRTDAGIDKLRPGVTGWAQVKGRDSLTIPEKVALEREYLERRSFGLDLRILALTAGKLFGDKTVSH